MSRAGASVVVVEVDGEATEAEFAGFAATTRVPRALQAAYTRFAMRTVVGVAPSREELRDTLAGAGIDVECVRRDPTSPFVMVRGVRG